MRSLEQLIDKYGSPDAIVDHWDNTSNQFAVWGFEEKFEITNKNECFINGNKVHSHPLKSLQNTINYWKSDKKNISAIGYISYDFKNFLYPHICFNNSNLNRKLVWFGKPKHIKKFQIIESKQRSSKMLCLKKDIPNPINYAISINKIKTHLKNGDTYQINFTQPKFYKLLNNALEVYLSLRSTIKPHCGMYLKLDDKQILCFSPERFFITSKNIIESFPMKGTSPRSNDPIHDKKLAKKLFNSIKDRAEHLMIVDLLRNDLGKICKYGSIEVENLFSIYSFETVHQMVSTVHGKLKKIIEEIDIIKALFPGGSITGAPKEKSMKIIDELEGYNRGIYTGSLGYIKNNGDMDFNIAIRTMTVQNNLGFYPVGGGIVWDSNSFKEWEEAQYKSEILSPYLQRNNYNNILNEVSL